MRKQPAYSISIKQPSNSRQPPRTPISSFRQAQTITVEQLPRVRCRSSLASQCENYNRYYIHPELRYRNKDKNPKEVPENYSDDAFIYNNLHNQSFWNWAHPLDDLRIKHNDPATSNKINLVVLERFKKYLEHRGGKRVPIVIRDILEQRSERK